MNGDAQGKKRRSLNVISDTFCDTKLQSKIQETCNKDDNSN